VFLFLLLEGLAVVFVSKNSYYQSSKMGNRFNNIAAEVYAQQDKITAYLNLISENERLAKENALLRSQLPVSQIDMTNDTINKEVSDTHYAQRYSYITGRIISRTTGRRNNLFMVNKGSKQGVEIDMGVICPNGLVGVVLKTTENFSIVMPVIHGDSKHSVRNERTFATGTLIWRGGSYSTGQVVDYPSSQPIRKGDTIVTSGFSSNIPEGVAVGYVKDFSRDEATGFYNIDIAFATDYNRISNVYIVNYLFRKEEKKLMEGIKNE
jgi:rod shape-determining protein MreC